MKILQTISTLHEKFAGYNTAAEILVDAKGRFLYVSNRGYMLRLIIHYQYHRFNLPDLLQTKLSRKQNLLIS